MAEQDWKELYKQQLAKRDDQKQDATKHDAQQNAVQQSVAQQKMVQSPARADRAVHERASAPATRPQTAETVRLFRKIVIAIWIGITGIQIIIWLLIGIFGNSFPDPWWLWTGVSGGVIVAVIWYISAELQTRKERK